MGKGVEKKDFIEHYDNKIRVYCDNETFEGEILSVESEHESEDGKAWLYLSSDKGGAILLSDIDKIEDV